MTKKKIDPHILLFSLWFKCAIYSDSEWDSINTSGVFSNPKKVIKC